MVLPEGKYKSVITKEMYGATWVGCPVLFWPAVVWLWVAVATLLTMGGATAARNVRVL